MTSRLRKSPRIIRWAITAPATAFSLLLACAGTAGAQAPTQWAPLPIPQIENRPVPTVVPVNPPPTIQPIVVQPGTVHYTKPPGETRPTVPVHPAVRPFPGGAVAGQPVSQEKPVAPAPVPTLKDAPPAPMKLPEVPAPTLLPGANDLPTKENVFRLDSDEVLNKRVLKELKKDASEAFPAKAELVPPGTPYVPKTVNYGPVQALLEPNYVVHRRLYFEEMNSDRHGWDHGPLQPVISSLYFYKDVLTWPHKLAGGLFRPKYDVSAGKCPPGAPTAYYFYPPGLTVSGSLFEAGIIIGTAVILP
jgi:hypothetical protein